MHNPPVENCGIVKIMNIIDLNEYRRLIPRTNKYRNKRTTYNGTVYDSKREAEYRKRLDLMTASSLPDNQRVVKVEEQVRFPIVVNGEKICTYVLDFRVTYADGHVEHVDVKGVRTQVYKLKKKLVRAVHSIDLIEV